MRAARLLQILLLLQNRGRMTSAKLADELEVSRRTILRDIDAITEAGLPVIMFQGNQGGVELGFSYRTRLTGLAADEAEAMGVILAHPTPAVDELGMSDAARRARSKLLESFPDGVRERIMAAQARFRLKSEQAGGADPRIAAFAEAVRSHRIVRINAHSSSARTIHPTLMTLGQHGWLVQDDISGEDIALDACGPISISRKSFAADQDDSVSR